MPKTSKNRQIALKRYKALWDFYNENGKITRGDCKRILEAKYLSHILATFDTHNLEIPPMHDSIEARYKRYSDRLMAAGKSMTYEEMATLLSEKEGVNIDIKAPSRKAKYILSMCKKYGYDVPDVKFKKGWKARVMAKEREKEIIENNNTDTGEASRWPRGLTAISARPWGKNGQVIYKLK